MTICIRNSTKYVIVTNSTTVIHEPIKMETNLTLDSNEPYYAEADTLEDVVAKIYDNPVKNADGEYDYSSLTVKSSQDIIDACV